MLKYVGQACMLDLIAIRFIIDNHPQRVFNLETICLLSSTQIRLEEMNKGSIKPAIPCTPTGSAARIIA